MSFKAMTYSAAGDTESLVGIVGKDFVMLGADSSISQSISVTTSNVDKIAVVVDPHQLLLDDKDSDDIADKHPRQQAILAAAAGDAADTDRLIGMLRAHAAIREYEAGVGCDVNYVDLDSESIKEIPVIPTFATSEPGLDTEGVAHLARGQIATALRSQTPLDVRLLIAGLTYNDDNPSEIHEFVSQQVQWQIQQTAGPQNPTLPSSALEETGIFQQKFTTLLQPRLFWLDNYGALQELQYGAHGYGSNFLLSILDNGYRPNMSREQAADLLRECFAQLRQRYIINSPQPPCIKCVDAKGCRLIDNPKT
jgi:20S proteasome subunit beta 4